MWHSSVRGKLLLGKMVSLESFIFRFPSAYPALELSSPGQGEWGISSDLQDLEHPSGPGKGHILSGLWGEVIQAALCF